MSWAGEMVAKTRVALSGLADSERARPMAGYMKHNFAFLGVPAPARRVAQRNAWKGQAAPAAADLAEGARLLWELPEREFQYAACDLLAKYQKVFESADLVSAVEPLIVAKSWWDSVDGLQSAVVGPLVGRHSELRDVVRGWVESDNIWLVRSAIIHQLRYGTDTDAGLLFELCSRRATDAEFFIAKAIGWALREYSYTNAAEVVAFVEGHPELRALSRREALKAVNRSAARR